MPTTDDRRSEPHPKTRKRNWTVDRVRERIRTGVIVRRLQDHVLGHLDLTQTQLRAAEILLKKTVPDLSAVEYTNTAAARPAEDMSDAELIAILQQRAQQKGQSSAVN